MEFEINNKKVVIPHAHLLSRNEFNIKIVNGLFVIVEDKCAICYEPFDENNPPKFLGNQCKCITVYHRNCIKNAIERYKSCPTCRAPKIEIVDTKFSNMNIAKYEELFHKALSILKGVSRLIFITNWKQQIPSQYLSVSTLVDPFAYLEYLRYDSTWSVCSIFEQSLTQIEFETPKYALGDQTIKDPSKFHQHFKTFTCNIIDDTFDWQGVVIAGGSISKLLMRHMELQDYPLDSDVDFFIYGQSPKDRTTSLINMLTYFCKKFTNKVYFAAKGYIIDIYITGIERTFQIVMASSTTIDNILYHFDLDHVQVAYKNGQVLATPQFIASFRY